MDDSMVSCWVVGCSSMLGLGEVIVGFLWLGGDDATSPMVKQAL
jgi:hypothetical protein